MEVGAAISIDGELWRKVPEPVIAVHFVHGTVSMVYVATDGHDLGAPVRCAIDTVIEPPPEMLLFRIDDLASVRALQARPGALTAVDHTLDMEVNLVTKATFDPEENAVLRSAQALVVSAESSVGGFDGDRLRAWLDLREMLSGRDGSNAPIDSVTDRLQAFCGEDNATARAVSKVLEDFHVSRASGRGVVAHTHVMG
jgi:hypothetical protein